MGQERAKNIYDLFEENKFQPIGFIILAKLN